MLAEVSLKVIQNIKAEGYDEETNNYNHFFRAFDNSVVQKRNINLIMNVCSRLELLVKDDALTADELKKLAP